MKKCLGLNNEQMSKKLCEYEQLMQDWNPSLNPNLNPKDITDGSHIMVLWKCHKCGREWKAPVKQRAKMNSGCVCDAMERKTKSLQKTLIEKKGSLAQNRPDIAKQWHPVKNGDLTPNDVTCGTEYKAWWIDSEGNEWQSAVNVRCRNEKVNGIPTKKLIVGKNDLATLNPALASEWNYERNGQLRPCDVMPHTKMKIWWKCYKGHEWQANISSRTSGRGCPECNKERNTSFPEQTIYYYTKSVFHNVENRFVTSNGYEIDVYLPNEKIGIEFDGEYYHQNIKKQKTDFEKNKALRQAGISLIRVAERKAIIPENTEHVIRYDSIKNGIKDFDAVLREIFALLMSMTSISCDVDINVERDSIRIWEQYIESEKENSIIKKDPSLLEEWNFDKNGALRPEYISYASNKKIWWKCKKCGYEWKTPPSLRAKGSSCPVCSGNIVVKGKNDLVTTHPDIALLWDKKKNGHYTPEDFSAGSGKIVWWKCQKCSYEWKGSIANRVRSLGCPICSGQVVTYETSLACRFPEIASQWDYEINDFGPDEVFPASEKKVWWKCDKGHKWRTTVSARTHGNGCPYCGNKKVLSGFNDLQTSNPPFLSQWSATKNTTTPDKVLSKSCKNVWWQCNIGHEYEASPATRWSGRGCPYCDGKKPVVGKNDLQSTHPEVVLEWNYEKNGDLTPNMVKAGSNKKVWWKCSVCSKEWQAIIGSRCRGRGCPFCAGKAAVSGVNDICTTHPFLIEEWDYSKNDINPNTKMHGSRYKAWWICKKCGYEWQATIGSRCSGRGCPKCAGKKR